MKIFYDVDTQNDFMDKDGALAVPGADAIRNNLERLTRHAGKNDIKILGSVDRHFGTEEYRTAETELQKWGGSFPEHCMDQTTGQLKISETSLDGLTRFIESQRLDSDVDLGTLLSSPQVIFEKQSYDVFYGAKENPGGNYNIEIALALLGVTEAVVYGVATDYCVKTAALELRKRGIDVYVVSDAIQAVNVNPDDGQKALDEMEKSGVKFVTTSEIVGSQ